MNKIAVETIDLTPTWEGIMPALIAAVQDGTPTGRQMAIDELMRLARIVDETNAKAKAEKELAPVD